MKLSTIKKISLLVVTAVGFLAHAESWRLLKPSNTGIPGEELYTVQKDAQDRLWVAARWPFWGEGGVGVYDFHSWVTYSNWDSGMPSQFIYDIAFAPNGDTWFGTADGVVRFDTDGAWLVFDTSNSPIDDNDVENVAVDQNGHVWVGAVGELGFTGSLHEFDGTTWTEHLPGSVPFGIYVDRDNRVWVDGGGISGIARYDGTSWVNIQAPAGHIFTNYAEAPDGTLWTSGSAVARFDGTRFVMEREESIRDIAIDSQGRVFIGSIQGWVDVLDDGSWSRFALLENWVGDIIIHDNDDVWIGTLGTLHHFTANGTHVESFNSYNTGVPDYFVDEFYCDRDGVMWVTTGEAGASRFEEPVWRNFGDHNWGSENWPFAGSEPCAAVYQEPDGTYWFAGNGIARGDLENWELWNWQNSNLSGAFFGCVGQDNNGELWIGSDGAGIARFTGTSDWDWHSFTTSYSGSYQFARDTANNFWVATQVGLHRFDGTTWTRFDETNTPFPIGLFTGVAAHPDGSIWVTSVEEVGRFDGTNWEIYTEANSPLPATNPAAITIRDDGLIAVTAQQGLNLPYYGGVALIDGEEWTVYTTANSPMQHWQVGAVAFDARGDLWISTLSEGIAILQFDQAGTPGDMNCDGLVSVGDIGAFVLALTNAANYPVEFPDCDISNGDVNGDGVVSVSDIGAFVARLTN